MTCSGSLCAACALWLFLSVCLARGAPFERSNDELEIIGQTVWPELEQNNGTQAAGSSGNPDEDLYKSFRHHGTKRHPLLFDWTTSCGECNPELCEVTPVNCPTGLIRDACDCCYVCGNLEDTPCDLLSDTFRFGQCGKGLICTPVAPQENKIGEENAFCTCVDNTVICGTDGRTYSNPCKFRRASGRKRGLSKAHIGPCLAAPLVEIPPMNQTAETGSTAVFSCSVSGFPLAWFEWLKDGENVFKPGDSHGIAVQIRSGPLKYQVTTWLEISKTLPDHAGTYECLAKNEHGTARAVARLDVIPGDYDATQYYTYRGKSYNFRASSTSHNPVHKSYYLRGHTLYDDVEEPQALTQQQQASSSSGAKTVLQTQETRPGSDTRSGQEGASNDNLKPGNAKLNKLLLQSLQKLVRPKEFKDIFFDDDDLTEGSGEQVT